jgi:AmmeMemoRadiSam system protein A
MTADGPLQPLTDAERAALLRLARRSIGSAVGVFPESVVDESALTPALRAPGAAFVSLHCDHTLRGCVGTLAADRPLYETVAAMAVAAAVNDPRFEPLMAAELSGVCIEISRLGPLVPAPPEQVVVGVHGVSLAVRDRRAVFLPRVAVEQGWTRDRLLRELCFKAHLPPEAWRSPEAGLWVFVAEVFAETH